MFTIISNPRQVHKRTITVSLSFVRTRPLDMVLSYCEYATIHDDPSLASAITSRVPTRKIVIAVVAVVAVFVGVFVEGTGVARAVAAAVGPAVRRNRRRTGVAGAAAARVGFAMVARVPLVARACSIRAGACSSHPAVDRPDQAQITLALSG
eukprot:SAG31_NODE_3769_length_3901_cov_2.916360_3_plen_151_part_01